jgi:hypothetical protein
MAVGTVVPKSVQLRALPSDLVNFIPQYRGYSYVVVEEQIVIVDPAAHGIVAIVPFTQAAPETRVVETDAQKTPAPVAQKPMVSRPVNLNTESRKVSRRATEQRKRSQSVTREVREERRTPRTVTIEEYDEPVYRPVPRPRGFFGLFGNYDNDADD